MYVWLDFFSNCLYHSELSTNCASEIFFCVTLIIVVVVNMSWSIFSLFFLLYQRFYCWLLSYIFLIQFNYCLQRFIGTRSQSEIDALVSAKTGGCSPLLIACRNGHYDVVQYLLKRCHADVEQCGSVIFDGETIENAPPLW